MVLEEVFRLLLPSCHSAQWTFNCMKFLVRGSFISDLIVQRCSEIMHDQNKSRWSQRYILRTTREYKLHHRTYVRTLERPWYWRQLGWRDDENVIEEKHLLQGNRMLRMEINTNVGTYRIIAEVHKTLTDKLLRSSSHESWIMIWGGH